MKIEDFDSRIKQKISQVEADFQERDWERFQYKLYSKDNSALKRWMIFLFFLFLLGGTGFTIWQYAFEKSEVKSGSKSILAIQKDLESKNTNSINPDLEQSNHIENQNGDGIKLNSSADAHVKNNSGSNLKNRSQTEGKEFFVEQSIKEEYSGNQTGIRLSEEIQLGADDIRTNTAEIENTINPIFSLEKLNVLQQSGVQSGQAENQIQNHLQFKKSSEIDKWAAGWSVLASHEHVNTGLLIERKTNGNISFRSGLLYQRFFEKEYQNEVAYKEDNEVEFTEIAKPRHSTTETFNDIRIQSSDVVLPLELKYTLPFSYGYAAFIFGGLQLTLQSKTVLEFDYLNHFTNQYLSEDGLNQDSNNSTLINNFGFGMGMQKNIAGLQWSLAGVIQKSNSTLPHIAKTSLGLQLAATYAF
ncbi:MAG: hypothetical protein IPM34_06010 [Saprospiraceae bacterium]|nr:hypothetical protein [Saprospiraceae bacterium]